jgi:hypothetical protein
MQFALYAKNHSLSNIGIQAIKSHHNGKKHKSLSTCLKKNPDIISFLNTTAPSAAPSTSTHVTTLTSTHVKTSTSTNARSSSDVSEDFLKR